MFNKIKRMLGNTFGAKNMSTVFLIIAKGIISLDMRH
jgi:hypothetical protein